MESDPLKDALTKADGVADRLSRLRRQAGLQAKDLAELLGWHPSKVSRLENGRTRPSAEDLDQWMQAVGAPESDAAEILAILTEARDEHLSWRRNMARGQAPVQVDYVDLQRRTTLFRSLDLLSIPGLLQTADYARHVFTEVRTLLGLPVDDIEAAVGVRARRQEFLYDQDRHFEFLVTEPALRMLFVPAPVMHAQLDRLQMVIGLANVRLGILPMGRGMTSIPQNNMALFAGDETVVEVESFTSVSYLRGSDVEVCGFAMDRLWADAVEGEEARALILAARDALPT